MLTSLREIEQIDKQIKVNVEKRTINQTVAGQDLIQLLQDAVMAATACPIHHLYAPFLVRLIYQPDLRLLLEPVPVMTYRKHKKLTITLIANAKPIVKLYFTFSTKTQGHTFLSIGTVLIYCLYYSGRLNKQINADLHSWLIFLEFINKDFFRSIWQFLTSLHIFLLLLVS